jgi:hypothetical protein
MITAFKAGIPAQKEVYRPFKPVYQPRSRYTGLVSRYTGSKGGIPAQKNFACGATGYRLYEAVVIPVSKISAGTKH